MQAYKLTSAELLRDFLFQKKENYRIFQTEYDENNNAYWQEASQGENTEIKIEPVLPQVSTKSLLFSERESLFHFDGEKFIATLPENENTVFFGVRACDLVAIAYQDLFFKDDPYYQARRKNTLLIGMDCLSPCENGFCTLVDAGPSVRDATADLILVPPLTNDELPDHNQWTLLIGSELGKNTINDMPLEKAEDDYLQSRKLKEVAAIAAFGNLKKVAEGIKIVNQNNVDPEVWQKAGIQCLTCSGCTNVCPTCSCYDIRDVSLDQEGQNEVTFTRERFWDSCLYEGFQKEASGHNPSEVAGQRVARFWYHKFSDDFAKDFGRYGCVGCGRCDQVCPGVIGARSIMKTIADVDFANKAENQQGGID